MWREASFVSYDVLFRHLPWETEENKERLEDNLCDNGIRIEHHEIKSVPAWANCSLVLCDFTYITSLTLATFVFLARVFLNMKL